jgi:hypothetical protein
MSDAKERQSCIRRMNRRSYKRAILDKGETASRDWRIKLQVLSLHRNIIRKPDVLSKDFVCECCRNYWCSNECGNASSRPAMGQGMTDARMVTGVGMSVVLVVNKLT